MHKALTGVTLIVLGVFAVLQSLGMFYSGLELWPAFVVFIGLEILWSSLFDGRHAPSVFGSALGLGIAALGLVKIINNVGFAFSLTLGDLVRVGWPVLLVALGLSILFGRRHHAGTRV
ncbi:MAG TPA: DUF5668 domain-containing protein [Symbiobacteriaceae bacterium]|jgi:hypothetical protein